jgi:hypothetical protein
MRVVYLLKLICKNKKGVYEDFLSTLYLIGIVTLLDGMDIKKVSLTQEYLELARIIEYTRPFSALPVEIKNKIAHYCLSSYAIKTAYIFNIAECCFSHLIKGMNDINQRYIGVYDMRLNRIVSTITIPFGIYKVIFDPVTATIAILQEVEDYQDGITNTSIRQVCMRVNMKKMNIATSDFTVCHLMAYYAKMNIKTSEDEKLLKLEQYRTVLAEAEERSSTWLR